MSLLELNPDIVATIFGGRRLLASQVCQSMRAFFLNQHSESTDANSGDKCSGGVRPRICAWYLRLLRAPSDEPECEAFGRFISKLRNTNVVMLCQTHIIENEYVRPLLTNNRLFYNREISVADVIRISHSVDMLGMLVREISASAFLPHREVIDRLITSIRGLPKDAPMLRMIAELQGRLLRVHDDSPSCPAALRAVDALWAKARFNIFDHPNVSLELCRRVSIMMRQTTSGSSLSEDVAGVYLNFMRIICLSTQDLLRPKRALNAAHIKSLEKAINLICLASAQSNNIETVEVRLCICRRILRTFAYLLSCAGMRLRVAAYSVPHRPHGKRLHWSGNYQASDISRGPSHAR